jgi:hypothetical protein
VIRLADRQGSLSLDRLGCGIWEERRVEREVGEKETGRGRRRRREEKGRRRDKIAFYWKMEK